MSERLYPARVSALLYELCVDLGFCVPPAEQRRLEGDPPAQVDAFTDAVFRAEGMEPEAHPRLRQKVRERVEKHFLECRASE